MPSAAAPAAAASLPGRGLRLETALPMTDEITDRELIRRIAREDREAFRLFYDRHAGRLLAYIRMLAREREAAEDLAQEVLLSVWRKAPSYRPDRGDVPAWLYTIARNKLVDLWRRRSARADEDGAVDLTRFESDEPGADGRVAALSVRQALGALKAEQRQALELAYFGGLTYEETAERLDLPLGTLKSRIRAGLAILRDVLTEPGPAVPAGTPTEAPAP